MGSGRNGPAQAEPVASARSPLTPQAFRGKLRGPIFSLPTPFDEQFEVDHAAIRKMVRRGQRYGVEIFALTGGNSLYDLLSIDEVKAITKSMVEAADGKGLVIAAAGGWWTAAAVDYAKYAESIGADAVQIQLPARNGGEDAVVEHYRTIAAATRLPLVLHGNFSESLLKKLVEIDSIAAMKEDITLEYYIDRQIVFGDRLEIFGGGAENRVLVAEPYGADAFYSVYTSFAPDIAMKFWKLLESGDIKGAAAFTRKYDHPFIKRFSHSFWHATLEYFGVAKRWMRPPMTSFTVEQVAELKTFFDGQGLDPAAYRD